VLRQNRISPMGVPSPNSIGTSATSANNSRAGGVPSPPAGNNGGAPAMEILTTGPAMAIAWASLLFNRTSKEEGGPGHIKRDPP